MLRELRIFLRDIWTKVIKESKFFMFRLPVNTLEVDDNMQKVKDPMDQESMHMLVMESTAVLIQGNQTSSSWG